MNPENDIQDAIERRDWFTGFAISVSFFEYYGKNIIKDYYENRNMQFNKKMLDGMGASDVIFILRVIENINNDYDAKMKKIIKERNKLIHNITYRDEKEETRAYDLLKQAIDCIKNIKI